jgi:hypothetical protein
MRAAIFEPLGDRRVLAAEVVTDLQDYAPGQTAVITAWNSDREGVNFVAGEPIRFQVTRTDGIPDFPQGNLPWLVTDGVGGFKGYYVDSDNDGTLDYGVFPDNDGTANAAVSTTWYVEPQYGDSTLRLHAEGQQSGAVATHDFTDSVTQLSVDSPSNASPITVAVGQQFTITYTVNLNNANPSNGSTTIISQIATAVLTSTGQGVSIPLGGTDSIGIATGNNIQRSFTVTVPDTTAVGRYKLEVTVTQTFQNSTTQTKSASQNDAVIIGDPTGAISSLTVGAQTGAAVYGGATDSVTFAVAANRGANGNINGTYGFTGLPTGVTGALSVTAFTVTGSTAPPSSVLTLQVASTVPAGSYPFTVTCVVGGATVTSSGVLLVNRAPLTVMASNANKIYGNAFTFDSTAPGDFAVSTLFNSDTVSTVTLSSTGAAADASVLGSPYPISIGNAIGAGLSNYDITYVAGTLTIDVRQLSFPIGDASIVYGSTTTFAGLPNTFATDVGSETLSIIYDSTGNSGTANVGEYPITGTVGDGTGLASNYAVTLTAIPFN